MLFNTLLGCFIFLVTNGSLLYTAHLLVRRFLPNAPASVRIVAIGTLFYSFIIVLFQALSPFHAITKAWVTISCILIAMVAHFIWGGLRDFKADIDPIIIWLRDGLNSRWAVLIIICGFVVLLSFSRALLMPPLAWDCLTYHLTFAALWIKKGTLLWFKAPDQIVGCMHLPINGELFAAWFLLPFRTDLIVNTMNFPITLLGGIACYAIARELGLTRKESSFAPALICFAPMIYSQITTEYVDNAVFTFCAASVLFTMRYLRLGYLSDVLLALAASGILLGIKYSAIPIVGLIFIAISLKTIISAQFSALSKNLGVILLGILIVCTLGGRQYIFNTIDAGNPLYPFPLQVSGQEVFEGWSKLDEAEKWISDHEIKTGWDKLSSWEKEYRKFCYVPLTAGPKFFIFVILAFISIFIRPHHVSRKSWYLLTIVWLAPIILFYADTAANVARRGYWSDGSARYLSPMLALLTIQSLVFLQKFNKYFKKMDFFLIALIVLDLLQIRNNHIIGVEVLYPLIILILPVLIITFRLVFKQSKVFTSKKEAPNNSSGSNPLASPQSSVDSIRRWGAYTMAFSILFIGLYLLQSYRDNSRYMYYLSHLDFHDFPRDYVNGWQFLDQPGEKKTIALSIGWDPPGHKWFFYPLIGRHLQNDVIYVSAKFKWETPTWLDRGLLRGKDFSIWYKNLMKKGVNYVFVQKPWPIEMQWVLRNKEKFECVMSDRNFKIFKCMLEDD